MFTRSIAIAAGIVVTISATADDVKKTPGWNLVVERGNDRRVIHLADGKIAEVRVGSMGTEPLTEGQTRTVDHVASPDGKRVLYELVSSSAGQPHSIAVADADGRNMRTLAAGSDNRRPAWSPDGKQIAFVSKRGVGGQHAYRIDADGRNEKQISRRPVSHISRPCFAEDGRVLFSVNVGREGKLPLMDLVISDGEKESVLINRNYVIEAFTSPDGSRLAAIVPNEMQVRDLKTGSVQTVSMKDVNPQWHVTFYSLLWRPDGRAVAFGFGFLGGRKQGTRIEGEDHFGVLSLDGAKRAIRTFRVDDNYKLLAWVTDEDLRRRK